MKQKPNPTVALVAAMVLLMSALAACGQADPVAIGEKREADQVSQPKDAALSMSRTLLPVARPFPLIAMAEPLLLDVDIPPPGRNAGSTLSVGLRISGSDSAQSAAVADSLVQAGLPARLILTRTEDATVVPLIRRDFNGHGPTRLVPVAEDAIVPGVVRDTVDVSALQEAGLVREGRHYRTVTFAWGEHVRPGRYRLSIQLIDPPPALSSVEAELLLAYQQKAK